ncbi:MAG: bifunctional diaminohydroxyphosphoribosylaminopyrimidine deaminase/5-amino-6-(5-phosphoribosylamino)uracil reductase RibD [Deltaproteobacteria bacterium]|nr:bifunctional diaminohydroxyphosphoribosylaminopyrimidine deaminase/5-amino-6-(5-phosphoribosylamino)uracil reductase RibD [Deltaproteobacteria bacterium]
MSHDRFMEAALAEARAVVGQTSPNPPVGAVVVAGGKIIARGGTSPAGGPHAEVVALAEAGARARGATLYSTLEPCNHHGRTAPCTERILEAGISWVVVGTRDRNPKVSGRGLRRLRAGGLEVIEGVAEAACQRLGEPFFTWARQGRPWVALKMAATLDGRIATATGDSRWVSGPEARSRVHAWRSRFDAVLVGAGTVRADDPRLNARPAGGGGRDPVRIILDGRLTTDPGARVYRQRSRAPTWVVLPTKAARARRSGFARKGVELIEVDGAKGKVELGALLAALGEREIVSLLVEGGAEVAGAFLSAGLVDELRLFLSPKIVGAGPAWVTLPAGVAPERMIHALGLTIDGLERVGDDLLLIAKR